MKTLRCSNTTLGFLVVFAVGSISFYSLVISFQTLPRFISLSSSSSSISDEEYRDTSNTSTTTTNHQATHDLNIKSSFTRDVMNSSIPLQENEAPATTTTTTTKTAKNSFKPFQNMTLAEWRHHRKSIVDSFFESGTIKKGKLLENADAEGPIMDFAVIGFPKCGTTTMEANLAYLAPMPESRDVCTSVHKTVRTTYVEWSEQFASRSYPNGTEKLLRGTKCPQYVSWPQELKSWSTYLPRTKLILGIRHPILWYQSFWNMQVRNEGLDLYINPTTGEPDPYLSMEPCYGDDNDCWNGCPHHFFCTNRARFHHTIAKLGKTSLTPQEREYLSPKDPDGGINLQSYDIKNDLFIYEQVELNEEYIWDALATFLGVDYIPHDRYHGSHGKKDVPKVDFCDDKYDLFRAQMMPNSFEMSIWMQGYLIPVAMDRNRTDVIIPNVTRFAEIVETFKDDPCGKLIRMEDGTYGLRNVTLSKY